MTSKDTPETKWLKGMKQSYKNNGLYKDYPEGFAEEVMHLIDDHKALSIELNKMGFRGSVKEKLTKFYKK